MDVQQITTIDTSLQRDISQELEQPSLRGVEDLLNRRHLNHGIPSILVENTPQPWFQTMTEPPYSEAFLLADLKRNIVSDGIKNHHPEVRQVVFDSFSSYPSIQKHYLRSSG